MRALANDFSSRLSIAGAATMLSIALSACGGAATPAASSPSSAGSPEPATIAEAQAELERARAELGLPPGAGAPTTQAAQAAPAPLPPESQKANPETTAPLRSTPEGNADASDADRCISSCRALGSMRRAVAAICRLAGDSDSRCVEAKDVLSASEQHVSPCHC